MVKTKPVCNCSKLPHQRTHAFNCPVQLAIPLCDYPGCSKRSKGKYTHANGQTEKYCKKHLALVKQYKYPNPVKYLKG